MFSYFRFNGISFSKNDFSKKWNASEKAKVTAEKTKETADAKVKNKAKKDGIAELHQKLKEAGHKGSKADAAALHDTHNGDIDAALDQKNKDKKVYGALYFISRSDEKQLDRY